MGSKKLFGSRTPCTLGLIIFYFILNLIKSLLLTTDLIPIVRFINEKRTFLGDPYISCTNSNVTNKYPQIASGESNYSDVLQQMKPDYDEYTCVFALFMDSLCRRCRCFPAYIDTDSLYQNKKGVCNSVRGHCEFTFQNKLENNPNLSSRLYFFSTHDLCSKHDS